MAISWIGFHITDRCQLDCDHCLRDPAKRATDLSLELIESVLDQARSLYGTSHVGLTGGEPTLHPRFDAIVDAIVDRGMTWHMVTNGERFDRTLARLTARPERLAGLTEMNFSLDGANEETHDSIRGAGSYRSVMRAVTTCAAFDVPFLVQMAVHARNCDEVEEMALLASQLGAATVSFGLTQPTGTFLDRSMHLSIDEARAIRDRIMRLIPLLTIRVLLTDAFPQKESFFTCAPLKNDLLYIDNHGCLELCCQHSGVPTAGQPRDRLGDLNEISLVEAHGRMVDRIHALSRARLEAMKCGRLEGWDASPCNWCLKQHQKPHWTADGVGGPDARRQRWRGARARKPEGESTNPTA